VESWRINKTAASETKTRTGIGGSVKPGEKTAGERPTIGSASTGGLLRLRERGPRWRRLELVGIGSARKRDSRVGGLFDAGKRGAVDARELCGPCGNLAGSPTQYEAKSTSQYRYYRTRWGIAREPGLRVGRIDVVRTRLYSVFKNIFGETVVYSLMTTRLA